MLQTKFYDRSNSLWPQGNANLEKSIFSSKPKSACLVNIVHLSRQIVAVPDTHQKEKQFWHVLKKCPGSAHFGAFFRSLLSFRGGWFFTLPHQSALFGPDSLFPMLQLKNTNHWNVIIFLDNSPYLKVHIWVNCYCWGNSSMVEGRFSKWF